MKNYLIIGLVAGGVFLLLKSKTTKAETQSTGAGFGFVDSAGVSHTLQQGMDGYYRDEKGQLWT